MLSRALKALTTALGSRSMILRRPSSHPQDTGTNSKLIQPSRGGDKLFHIEI